MEHPDSRAEFLPAEDTWSILVTGAAGFLGSHLCEKLLEAGCSVWGLDNFRVPYNRSAKWRNLDAALRHPRMHLVEGDIRDGVLLDGLFEGRDFDAVAHLAALPGVRTSLEAPDQCMEINVGGTLALLEAITRNGIPRFVFASSSSVYGEARALPFDESDPCDRPISPYAVSKRAGEMLCHAYHRTHELSVHCLRIFTTIGPRQRPDLAVHKFVRLLRRGDPIPLYGDGSSERDYAYVDDVVDGIHRSLLRLLGRDVSRPEYQVVNLGSGRRIQLARVVELLSTTLEVRPNVDFFPHQPGSVRKTEASLDRARDLLGWRPQTSFEDGVAAFVRWYDVVSERKPDVNGHGEHSVRDRGDGDAQSVGAPLLEEAER